MRVLESAAGGVVATVVAVLVMSRMHIHADLAICGAVAFLVGFLMVMLRPDRQYVERGHK
jgi:sugar phosphate permease